eukprot:SAG31_NODE_17245_length_678_cov_0.823834_2_plen_55_part_01
MRDLDSRMLYLNHGKYTLLSLEKKIYEQSPALRLPLLFLLPTAHGLPIEPRLLRL